MTMATDDDSVDDVFQSFETPEQSKEAPKETPQDLEDFDPFQIGNFAGITTTPKSSSKRKSKEEKTSEKKVASSGGSVASRASTKLAPRLEVKFKLHEEVTSTSDPDGENEGSSDIFVEGIVQVCQSRIWFVGCMS
jgi:hypothetical protein